MNKFDVLLRHIQALLFSAGEPLSPPDILVILQESIDEDLELIAINKAIESLQEKLGKDNTVYQLQLTGGGWQLLTKPEYHQTLSIFFKQQSGKRLSKSALETLSIVAYKQPVTKSEIEAIRGVSSDYALNKLLERELISIHGRDPGPGRPLLYETSTQFMDYFGLGDISDLPKLRELKSPENSIGTLPEFEESSSTLAENKNENLSNQVIKVDSASTEQE